jgi:hypothetical protein
MKVRLLRQVELESLYAAVEKNFRGIAPADLHLWKPTVPFISK